MNDWSSNLLLNSATNNTSNRNVPPPPVIFQQQPLQQQPAQQQPQNFLPPSVIAAQQLPPQQLWQQQPVESRNSVLHLNAPHHPPPLPANFHQVPPPNLPLWGDGPRLGGGGDWEQLQPNPNQGPNRVNPVFNADVMQHNMPPNFQRPQPPPFLNNPDVTNFAIDSSMVWQDPTPKKPKNIDRGTLCWGEPSLYENIEIRRWDDKNVVPADHPLAKAAMAGSASFGFVDSSVSNQTAEQETLTDSHHNTIASSVSVGQKRQNSLVSKIDDFHCNGRTVDGNDSQMDKLVDDKLDLDNSSKNTDQNNRNELLPSLKSYVDNGNACTVGGGLTPENSSTDSVFAPSNVVNTPKTGDVHPVKKDFFDLGSNITLFDNRPAAGGRITGTTESEISDLTSKIGDQLRAAVQRGFIDQSILQRPLNEETLQLVNQVLNLAVKLDQCQIEVRQLQQKPDFDAQLSREFLLLTNEINRLQSHVQSLRLQIGLACRQLANGSVTTSNDSSTVSPVNQPNLESSNFDDVFTVGRLGKDGNEMNGHVRSFEGAVYPFRTISPPGRLLNSNQIHSSNATASTLKDDNAFLTNGFESAFNGLAINSSTTGTAINKPLIQTPRPTNFISWSSKRQSSNEIDIWSPTNQVLSNAQSASMISNNSYGTVKPSVSDIWGDSNARSSISSTFVNSHQNFSTSSATVNSAGLLAIATTVAGRGISQNLPTVYQDSIWDSANNVDISSGFNNMNVHFTNGGRGSSQSSCYDPMNSFAGPVPNSSRSTSQMAQQQFMAESSVGLMTTPTTSSQPLSNAAVCRPQQASSSNRQPWIMVSNLANQISDSHLRSIISQYGNAATFVAPPNSSLAFFKYRDVTSINDTLTALQHQLNRFGLLLSVLQNHEVEQLLQHALTNGQSQNPALLALNHHFNAQQQQQQQCSGLGQFPTVLAPPINGRSLNPSADPWLPSTSRQSSRLNGFLDQSACPLNLAVVNPSLF